MKIIISTTFLSILLLIFFQNCHRIGGCDVIPQVLIHYIDSTGKDLFNNGQNGFVKDSTYEMNSYGDIIPNSNDGSFVDWANSTMQLGPSGCSGCSPIVNNYTSYIVHLRYGINDTLKMHLTSDGCTTLDSIWYNGQLKKAGNQTINGVTNPDLYTTMFMVVH